MRGIVTAVHANLGFYLGDEGGGPFSGLYVYANNPVAIGDMVRIKGIVKEVGNITQLRNLAEFDKLSSGNPVPITDISTADLGFDSPDSERYEGVLVRFYNVQITSAMDSFNRFKIADNSGVEALVDKTLYLPPGNSIVAGEQWYQMRGVVDYHSQAGYKILPRAASDLVKDDDASGAAVWLENVVNAMPGKVSNMSIYTSRIKADWEIYSYYAKIKFDTQSLIFQGLDTRGSLSAHTPEWDLNGDTIEIFYTGTEPLNSGTDEAAVLLKLQFEPLKFGDSSVELLSFKYEDVAVTALTNGSLKAEITKNIAYLSIGTDAGKKNTFDPSMNEKLELEYGTKKGFLARALIRIYDAQGRLVATPLHQNFSSPASIEKTTWNGRDSNMKILPPGLYYCHLEISNRESGGRYETVQPIVIKSRLK